ncbi:MAG: twin-arginine translocation signal domain-containing protein [Halorientalis sp.]
MSRRGFLASSAAAMVVAGVGVDETIPTRSVDEIVLRRADLREDASAPYVDRGAAPAQAPLVKHLRTTLSGFTEEAVALSGFQTTAAAPVPTHVESAAFEHSDAWSREALARACGAWLGGDERDAAGMRFDRRVGPGGVQWLSRGHDGSLDVFRLRATSAGPTLLTIAHGDEDAGVLAPAEAVEQYETTMRDRVRL